MNFLDMVRENSSKRTLMGRRISILRRYLGIISLNEKGSLFQVINPLTGEKMYV
jgi:hypothetical protein